MEGEPGAADHKNSWWGLVEINYGARDERDFGLKQTMILDCFMVELFIGDAVLHSFAPPREVGLRGRVRY